MVSEEKNLELKGLEVADHVTAMLAYWDKDLVCQFANAAYRDWFGKTRDEMVNKMTIRELLGPLYQKNLPYILGALEGKVQVFEREIPIPAGGTRHSLATYTPDIVNGIVEGFFVHVADISQLKLLEKELIHSNELIKKHNERLTNFSNIVSHNLKSYSNNLKGLLDLLMKADSEDERQVILKYLRSVSEAFSTTIENLSEIVAVQNINRLKLKSLNVHQYVAHILEMLEIQIKSNHAIILTNIDHDLEIMANPAYLESILLNLLTNAIKYRHPKRIPVIEIDASVKKDEIEIRVKDNGLGIDLKKHKASIFGMYKVFHGNSDAKGIGLFITKQQVEAMNGVIDVESEVEKGTTFIIRLPYHKE